MNDVEELKRFVGAHARAQGIAPAVEREVLARIAHDGTGAGSWTAEWSRAGEEFERAGDLLSAARMFNMARFPYVDAEARQDAYERSVHAFDEWRLKEGAPLRPLEISLPGGHVKCWTTDGDGPFVVMMGGIVSNKEQWALTLLRLRRMGVRGLVTELPGIGSNTLPYTSASWRMFSDLLDGAAEWTDTGRVYAMAMSFSGNLALRCALADPRIRAVITVGAPVRAVFADPEWQRTLPRVTVETIAHLARVSPDRVWEHLSDLALEASELSELEIPVSYVSSSRDEIIPASDVELLERNVRRLRVLTNDDVHGSPGHFDVTGPWLIRELFRAHGSGLPKRAVLSAALPVIRARRLVGGAR